MKCKNCGAEIDKKAKVCPSCNAKVEKVGYFNFIKRREQRYEETQQLLAKSYVSDEQLSSAEVKSHGGIKAVYVGECKKLMRIAALKIALFAFIMAGSIAVIIIRQYTSLMSSVSDTWTTVILLIAFIAIFGMLALLYDTAYYLVRCIRLNKQGEGVAKINFGKPPVAISAGKLYNIALDFNCPKCANPTSMHIEQVDDMFVAVCDYDRTHMLKIEVEEILENIRPTQYSSDENIDGSAE
ncbi:MAG: hypothetical protein K2M44_02305 [Clostridia bacterium]|nr:hypothetical protein [Clostridia bacterium]